VESKPINYFLPAHPVLRRARSMPSLVDLIDGKNTIDLRIFSPKALCPYPRIGKKITLQSNGLPLGNV
jgi:hypothetical protein